MLLIADEVITGFGRLGRWFGSDVFGIEPDLITVAKGITSGYVPLSACIVSEKVWRVLVDGRLAGAAPSATATRTRAHPLARRGGDGEPRPDRAAKGSSPQAASRGAFMHERLHEAFADHPLVGEIRGHGADRRARVRRRHGRRRRQFDPPRKVAARDHPPLPRARRDHPRAARADTISFSPPFVITEDELEEMVRMSAARWTRSQPSFAAKARWP